MRFTILRAAALLVLVAPFLLVGCTSSGLDSDQVSAPLIIDTVPVEADARVASNLPSVPLGEGTDLVVGTIAYAGGPTIVNRTLVRLPPLAVPLDSVELSTVTLILSYQDPLDTFSYPISATRITEAWDEPSVTWLSQPTVAAVPFQTVTVQNGSVRFDVASIYADTAFVNGVELSTAWPDIYLHARESDSTDLRPKVVFMYRMR